MSVDNYIALFSAAISFAGLLLVALQLRDGTDQRRLESAMQVYSINREIISLGFTTPELLTIMHGKKADPLVERHYLQLWFNHFVMIYSFRKRAFFPKDLGECLERDIRDFMDQGNMKKFWRQNRQYYPASFQLYLDQLTQTKADAPQERPPQE